MSVKSGKDVLCVQYTIIIRNGCCVSLEDMMFFFSVQFWEGCCVCFSGQFGMDAVCVSVYNLGMILCVFQCTIREGCFSVQFGMDALCVSVYSLG